MCSTSFTLFGLLSALSIVPKQAENQYCFSEMNSILFFNCRIETLFNTAEVQFSSRQVAREVLTSISILGWISLTFFYKKLVRVSIEVRFDNCCCDRFKTDFRVMDVTWLLH